MSWVLTMAAISATTTAIGIRNQNKAIQQQQESINATTKMNYLLKQQQEQELKAQAGMELTQEKIKRVEERGKIRVAQAESGVAGVSPLRELANSYIQESLTAGSIISSAEAKQRSIALENQSSYLQSLSEINRLESQATTGLDAWLQTGVAGLNTYLGGGGKIPSMGSTASASTAGNAIVGSNEAGYGVFTQKTTGTNSNFSNIGNFVQ